MVKKTLWWDILQNAVYEVKKNLHFTSFWHPFLMVEGAPLKEKYTKKFYNETPAQQAWEGSKTPHGLWGRWHTRTFHVCVCPSNRWQTRAGLTRTCIAIQWMGSSSAVLQHQAHHHPQLTGLIFLRGSSVLQGLGFLRIIDWGEEINGWVFYLLSYSTQGVNK